jgi:hypothetical protein
MDYVNAKGRAALGSTMTGFAEKANQPLAQPPAQVNQFRRFRKSQVAFFVMRLQGGFHRTAKVPTPDNLRVLAPHFGFRVRDKPRRGQQQTRQVEHSASQNLAYLTMTLLTTESPVKLLLAMICVQAPVEPRPEELEPFLHPIARRLTERFLLVAFQDAVRIAEDNTALDGVGHRAVLRKSVAEFGQVHRHQLDNALEVVVQLLMPSFPQSASPHPD